jgi:hypothetical protein
MAMTSNSDFGKVAPFDASSLQLSFSWPKSSFDDAAYREMWPGAKSAWSVTLLMFMNLQHSLSQAPGQCHTSGAGWTMT